LRVPTADLRRQYLGIKSDIDSAVFSLIESGSFVDGAPVDQLEESIAAVCGTRYGVAVASGTDALTLSLAASGIGPGDEVITTPFTFCATTEAIALVGARPVYADIDSCTFNLDVEQVERLITPRTKVILPVDLFGHMVNRRALADIARKHNLTLISDSAQAIGARQYGRPIGAETDMSTLSFYPSKNLGAYGDGGMVLTSDPDIAKRLRSLRAHGIGERGAYYHERVGYCSRLDSLQAVVLRAKLPHLASWNEGRRRNAAMYHELLSKATETSIVLPRCEPGNYHIYHQYTIRSPHRDRLQAYLREHDVETKIFYPIPMHLQPAYAYLGYKEGDFPTAERAAREVLSLPIHPELTADQIHYAADLMRNFR